MARPKKNYKSLDDDDDDVTVILESNNKLEKEEDENTEAGVDLVEDSVINEDIQVSGNADDGDLSVSLTNVRRNMPPPKTWDEGVVLKFKIGDLVCVKEYPTIFKVVGAGKEVDTYALKPSGFDNFHYFHENRIKKAPADAEWKNYWDTISDPYMAWKKKQEEQQKKVTVAVPEKLIKTSKKRKSKK